jgi:hypothetical protein
MKSDKPHNTLMMKLREALYAEHEMKCELLECEPPETGDHQDDTCRVCDLIRDALRQEELVRRIADDLKMAK